MKKVKLVTREDLSLGEIGMMCADVRMIETPMVSLEGRLIAHDIIEHVNGLSKIGSVDDELEALGAVWYVRGQWGDLSRDGYGSMHTPESSLGHDVGNLAEVYMNGVEFRTPVPRTRAHDHDSSFEEMIRIGSKSFRDNYNGEDDEWIDLDRLSKFKVATLHYLRKGYMKAQRKYKDVGRANTIFWNIAQAVDPYAKNCEYEGQEFLLRYDDHHAVCEEVYDDLY